MVESIIGMYRRVRKTRSADIIDAVRRYAAATGRPGLGGRVPVEMRMAARIDCGLTPEQAATREIIYRVGLAWQSQVCWLLPAGWEAGTEAGDYHG